MNTEGFFRKKEGKLVFAGHASVGISNAVDSTALHQRVSGHFYAGDGWPADKPINIEQVNIWDSFKGMTAPH